MKVNKNKYIPLDRFINKSLYDKKIGYYMTKNPFGKNGDFITSPNISIMFSEMIAIWCISFWENLGSAKKINIIDLVVLSKLESSKSEIRRLIKGNGIKINNQVINDEKFPITEKLFSENFIKLSIGKKRHIKVKLN